MPNKVKLPQTSFMPLPQGWACRQAKEFSELRGRECLCEFSIVGADKNEDSMCGSYTTLCRGVNDNFTQSSCLIKQKRRKVDEAVSSIIRRAKTGDFVESNTRPWRSVHTLSLDEGRRLSMRPRGLHSNNGSLNDPIMADRNFPNCHASPCFSPAEFRLTDDSEASLLCSYEPETSLSNVHDCATLTETCGYDKVSDGVWRNPFHRRGQLGPAPKYLPHKVWSPDSLDWHRSPFPKNSQSSLPCFDEIILPKPTSPSQFVYHSQLDHSAKSLSNFENFPDLCKSPQCSRDNRIPSGIKNSLADRSCCLKDEESVNALPSKWRGSNSSNSLIYYITQGWPPLANPDQSSPLTSNRKRSASTQTENTTLANASSQTDECAFICPGYRKWQTILARHSQLTNPFGRKPNTSDRLLASAQLPQNCSPIASRTIGVSLEDPFLVDALQPTNDHFLCKSLDLSCLNED